jgi:zinc protease
LPAPVTGYHEGGADKAAALLVWPLYVANVARRDEEYAINLAATIFRDRLMQRARMKMGKAYSPSVGSVTPDDADQGYLAATFETTPQDIDALVAAAREIAQDLAAGNITEAELEQARVPMLADRRQALTRNEAWAGILSLSYRFPEAIDELVRYRDQMQALTLADVKRAAATWLRQEPMIARSLPDPKSLATSGAAPSGPAGAMAIGN